MLSSVEMKACPEKIFRGAVSMAPRCFTISSPDETTWKANEMAKVILRCHDLKMTSHISATIEQLLSEISSASSTSIEQKLLPLLQQIAIKLNGASALLLWRALCQKTTRFVPHVVDFTMDDEEDVPSDVHTPDASRLPLQPSIGRSQDRQAHNFSTQQLFGIVPYTQADFSALSQNPSDLCIKPPGPLSSNQGNQAAPPSKRSANDMTTDDGSSSM